MAKPSIFQYATNLLVSGFHINQFSEGFYICGENERKVGYIEEKLVEIFKCVGLETFVNAEEINAKNVLKYNCRIRDVFDKNIETCCVCHHGIHNAFYITNDYLAFNFQEKVYIACGCDCILKTSECAEKAGNIRKYLKLLKEFGFTKCVSCDVFIDYKSLKIIQDLDKLDFRFCLKCLSYFNENYLTYLEDYDSEVIEYGRGLNLIYIKETAELCAKLFEDAFGDLNIDIFEYSILHSRCNHCNQFFWERTCFDCKLKCLFGKHKGETFDYVFENDYDYCKWVIEQDSSRNSNFVEFKNYCLNKFGM